MRQSARTSCVLNELDGFSVTPRFSIPFTGEIDLSTVTGNVFLRALLDASVNIDDHNAPSRSVEGTPGAAIGITQIVWDAESRTLYAKSRDLLEEHTRYALIITTGIRSSNGEPIIGAPEFTANHLESGRSESTEDLYHERVLDVAVDAAERSGVQRAQIAAISVFTTQSVTYLRDKISRQLMAAPLPDVADFNIGPGGTRAVFSFQAIQALLHNQQTLVTGPLVSNTVSLEGSRFVNGAVGRLAYGRFTAPDYMVRPGEYIPPIKSRTGSPVPLGNHTIYFSLSLPNGPMPAEGWPVVIFGIGGNGNRITALSDIAAIPASSGLAVLAIDNLGHGLGPLSTVTVELRDGLRITVPAPGRGVDQNADGMIGTAEGHSARAPRELSMYADASIQLGADYLSLIRVVQRGMDVDGDGRVDLDAGRIYFFGQSLGAAFGLPFVAITQTVRASVFMAPFGTAIESRRLTPTFRSVTGTILAQREPSLLNAANGITSVGGLPVAPPYFNEDIPLRDGPPVINKIPGALAIQQWMDRVAWRMQSSNPAAYTSTPAKAFPP